jgi:hypothetical protein
MVTVILAGLNDVGVVTHDDVRTKGADQGCQVTGVGVDLDIVLSAAVHYMIT